MHTITLTHTTDTGHRIPGHEEGRGKCARLHGHTYSFDVELSSDDLDKTGFVIDFGQIKKLLDEWDHRTLLWEGDPLGLSFHEFRGSLADGTASAEYIEGDVIEEAYGLIRVPFVPTAENMAEHLARTFFALPNVMLARVTVRETAKSSATHELVSPDFFLKSPVAIAAA